jgi:plasmid stability protein
VAQKFTVEVSDEVSEELRVEATRSGRLVDDVVREALVDHLGWQAVAQLRERNVDLDEPSASKLADDELRAARAKRRSA